MSFFSRNINFIVILYCTYIHSVSGEQPNSHIQNAEQFEDQGRRPKTNPSMPIACRVCDKIFFDNVSLVLHFECHLNDKILISREDIRSPAAWQGSRILSSSPSCFSCPLLESMSEVHHFAVPAMSEHSRAHWLPGSSTKIANASSPQIPDVNPIPPLSSSLDASRWGLLQQDLHSTMSRRTTSSSLNYQPFCSKLVHPSRSPRGLATVLNEQNNMGNLSIPRNPEINLNQVADPIEEIVIISDDEEDINSSPVEMLDLTLKL